MPGPGHPVRAAEGAGLATETESRLASLEVLLKRVQSEVQGMAERQSTFLASLGPVSAPPSAAQDPSERLPETTASAAMAAAGDSLATGVSAVTAGDSALAATPLNEAVAAVAQVLPPAGQPVQWGFTAGIRKTIQDFEAWDAKLGWSARNRPGMDLTDSAKWPSVGGHEDGWSLEGLSQPLIYIVSNVQRSSRRQRFAGAFRGLRLREGFEWAPAINVPKELQWLGHFADKESPDYSTPGYFAWYITHLATMREAHQRCPVCDLVVLEDAVIFRSNFLKHWSSFIQALPQDWAMLRLGARALPEQPFDAAREYIRAAGVSDSWGYVVRAKQVQRLADLLAGLPVRGTSGIDAVLQRFTPELATYMPQVPLVYAPTGCRGAAEAAAAGCETAEALRQSALEQLNAWPLGYARPYCLARGKPAPGRQPREAHVGNPTACADPASDWCCPYADPPVERPPSNKFSHVIGTIMDAGEHKGDLPEWFVVHTPKGAGTSFARDATKVLQPGVHFKSAEKCLLSMKKLRKNRGDGWGGLVREPRAHVLSQFLMCKFSKFGQQVVPAQKKHVLNGTFQKWLAHFNGGRVLDNLNCYHPLNFQVRIFSCDDDRDEVPHHATGSPQNPQRVAEPLKLALHNLRTMPFVGLVDKYQASLCLFAALANPAFDLPVFCNCADELAWKSFSSFREEHGLPKHSVNDITPEERRLLDELTKEDDILYRAAQVRFKNDVRTVERERRVRILC